MTILLRDLIANPSSWQESLIAELLIDAGCPLDANALSECRDILSCEVIIPGKRDIIVSIDFWDHSTANEISASMVSNSAVDGVGKVKSFDGIFFELKDRELFDPDRRTFLDFLKSLLNRQNESYLTHEYFEKRVEFLKDSIKEIEKEYLDTFGSMISNDRLLVDKLGELKYLIYGLTKNGKQQYH